MFSGCKRVVVENPAAFQNVTSATGMFNGVKDLQLPDGIDFPKVTTGFTNLTVPMFAGIGTPENPVALPDSITLPKIKGATIFGTGDTKNTYISHLPQDITFENVTSLTEVKMFFYLHAYIYFRKATFDNAGGSFNKAFCWGLRTTNSSPIDMPKATLDKLSSDGSAYNNTWSRFRLPSLTFASMATWSFANPITEFFYGDMPNLNLKTLNSGNGMFKKCCLTKRTVQAIADTIKTQTSGSHVIDLGIDATLENDPDVIQAIETVSQKGWTTSGHVFFNVKDESIDWDETFHHYHPGKTREEVED